MATTKAKYIRDGRAPIPRKETTSRVMSANKGKNTGPEVKLRKSLQQSGLTEYKLHPKGLPGRPDIIFPRSRLAIFVNGCYWHRCPTCKLPLPKSNRAFWRMKFKLNMERDRRNLLELRAQGWKALTLWECKLERNLEKWVRCIENNVLTSKASA